MKRVRVFVPGKVHLSGEHAVVYGYPALLAALNLGVTVTIEESEAFAIQSQQRDGMGLITQALKAVDFKETAIVTVETTLPVGSGLGSSAAVAAAVIKAVFQYRNAPLAKEEWFELTMECERIAHGNPSGGDPAAVISGGVLRFVKGESPKSFLVACPLELTLVQTGKPVERTVEMVGLVAERVKRDEKKTKQLFQEIGTVTEEIFKALTAGKECRKFIDRNGILLEQLGIVGARAREICTALRARDVAVKVSGAGGVRKGSGILVALGNEKVIGAVCAKYDLANWRVVVGGDLDKTGTINNTTIEG